MQEAREVVGIGPIKEYKDGKTYVEEYLIPKNKLANPKREPDDNDDSGMNKHENKNIEGVVISGLPLYYSFEIYDKEILLVKSSIVVSDIITAFRYTDADKYKELQLKNHGYVKVKFDVNLKEEDIPKYEKYVNWYKENENKPFGESNYIEIQLGSHIVDYVRDKIYNGTLLKDNSEENLLKWSQTSNDRRGEELKIIFRFETPGDHKLHVRYV